MTMPSGSFNVNRKYFYDVTNVDDIMPSNPWDPSNLGVQQKRYVKYLFAYERISAPFVAPIIFGGNLQQF